MFAGLTVEELTARFQGEERAVRPGAIDRRGARSIRRSARARFVLAQQHPQIGAIETLAPVVRLSRTPAEVTLPPPALGEHTEETTPVGVGLGISGLGIGHHGMTPPLWASWVSAPACMPPGSRDVVYVPDNPLSHVLRVLRAAVPRRRG